MLSLGMIMAQFCFKNKKKRGPSLQGKPSQGMSSCWNFADAPVPTPLVGSSGRNMLAQRGGSSLFVIFSRFQLNCTISSIIKVPSAYLSSLAIVKGANCFVIVILVGQSCLNRLPLQTASRLLLQDPPTPVPIQAESWQL